MSITNDDVMKALRGPGRQQGDRGHPAQWQPKPFEVTIERGKIPINSVAVALMDADGTGYIKLSRFARPPQEEFMTAARGPAGPRA